MRESSIGVVENRVSNTGSSQTKSQREVTQWRQWLNITTRETYLSSRWKNNDIRRVLRDGGCVKSNESCKKVEGTQVYCDSY